MAAVTHLSDLIWTFIIYIIGSQSDSEAVRDKLIVYSESHCTHTLDILYKLMYPSKCVEIGR